MHKLPPIAGLTLALTLILATPAFSTDFKLTSTGIHEGQPLTTDYVYKGFGCEGANMSPELSWSGAPEGTKSFAITAYDPDAPTGSGWWHWMVVNIPANTHSLPKGASMTNAMPDGATELVTDYGTPGFGGACPPPGTMHRYEFTVFALKTDHLDLPPNPGQAPAGFMIRANALASAKITAPYTR